MSYQDLQAQVASMRFTAIQLVQRHAAIYAPDVTMKDVNAICGALGEISIDEACTALGALQEEYGNRDPNRH